MVKITRFLFLIHFCFLSVNGSFADSKNGTEMEARTLLERAVNLIRVDEVVGLTMITIPNGGFHQKDLYPFCIDGRGILMAHPYLLGSSIKDFVSEDGVKVGVSFLKNARDGTISELTYIQPIFANGKLTGKTAKKTSFFTRVGNHVCASGFYK